MTRYWILFFVMVAMVIGIGIGNDKASCDRSAATRVGLNYAAQYFDQRAVAADRRARIEPPRLAALDRQSAAAARAAADRLHVPQLDCSLPLPAIH